MIQSVKLTTINNQNSLLIVLNYYTFWYNNLKQYLKREFNYVFRQNKNQAVTTKR